jgi:hypothetical protein
MKERSSSNDRPAETGGLSLETKLWRLAQILAAARRIHSSLSLDDVLTSFLMIPIAAAWSAHLCAGPTR